MTANSLPTPKNRDDQTAASPSLRERVLEVAPTLSQPFLVPDVREHIPEAKAASIFHVLRDLWDEGLVTWSGSEGYRFV